MAKKYEVAIGNNGIVAKCKLVDEEEFKRLIKINEQELLRQIAEKDLLNKRIEKLENKISSLEKEIKVLKGEN